VSDQPISGRAALVTGGGKGIGRAIAIGLAELGASVVVASRTKSEIDAVRAEIENRGGVSDAVEADVADPDAVERLLKHVRSRFGPVDVLVNNAAVVWPIGASRSIDPDTWAEAIDINVVAVARLSFAVLSEMLDRSWGRIVNISSGIAGNPGGMIGANAYATSKAALEAHTIGLAAELEGTGVTVNAYRPGGVDTAMQGWIRDQPIERVGQGLHDRFVEWKEGGTLLTPEASAAALLPRIATEETGAIWDVQHPL
jgi:NAD(P)-dependent dehydrogenase (short-subunit alcohol dehydrogenase family)